MAEKCIPMELVLDDNDIIRIRATRNDSQSNKKYTVEINSTRQVEEIQSILKDICDVFGLRCEPIYIRMELTNHENIIKEYNE